MSQSSHPFTAATINAVLAKIDSGVTPGKYSEITWARIEAITRVQAAKRYFISQSSDRARMAAAMVSERALRMPQSRIKRLFSGFA